MDSFSSSFTLCIEREITEKQTVIAGCGSEEANGEPSAPRSSFSSQVRTTAGSDLASTEPWGSHINKGSLKASQAPAEAGARVSQHIGDL